MIQSALFWVTLFGATAIYWMIPQRGRFAFLATVSFGYLASLDLTGTITLIAWILLFFYVAPWTLKAKRYSKLVLSGLVLAILTQLIWYKYTPAFTAFITGASPGLAIAIPLGISYFTFKLIHYAVETSRGHITDRSLSAFFCYIFLFPIFTAGPIERFDHFLANTKTQFDPQYIADGLNRIAFGLIKIFIIAKILQSGMAPVGLPANANQLVANIGTIEVWKIWTFLALTYLYAYFDFSAYSDIAIGASRLFGIRIMENFKFPILAVNISDFWKRWHMTLAGWCQTYVYMPVMARTRMPYAAVFATFTAMGLWHGATMGWLLWGLYHATGVALYMTWARYARRFEWWRMATGSSLKYLGIPITFAFISGSYAFSSTHNGGLVALQVFLSLFGIRIDI